MLAHGDRACSMEVSSHALELHRADAIHFDAAIFTNMSRDHLDFHPSMEDYFNAKRRLFSDARPRHAVVNIDDPYGARLAGELPAVSGIAADGEHPAVTTIALDRDATYRAVDVVTDLGGSRFTVLRPDGPVELTSPLRGRFNIFNVLGAYAAALALGVPREAAVDAIASAGRVPGRFEPVDEGQDFLVVVDYAHTPDSLENVLRAARSLTRSRLHVVFGAGGDRDRGKRPLMGEIAAKLADRVIVTSDNPRSEDPEAIIDAILAGTGQAVEHNVDRRAAIGLAIAGAGSGDVVVIAGKGHEQGQELEGGRKLPFDDASVAREVLRGAALTR
jgi:UDP-N-acetylmuramoyl-L-alanyl-D-glutamate--2,6-diaminopimelate ligase